VKYIPLLILKGKQGGSRRQERDAGKNKRGVCPCAVLDNWSFYGLSKDQRRRIFAGWSLHGFLRSSQRPHPVAKAPRKPDGLHGDHLPALTKTAILFLPVHGFFLGFAKTVFRCKRILQAVWSLQRPFSGAYKDHLPERKKAATRAVFKD